MIEQRHSYGSSDPVVHRVARTDLPDGSREIEEHDLEAINRLSRVPLAREDVYVRSMYLASDKLCPSDWGRFTENALECIASLCVGRAVLRGHDRSSLPLGRFFRAAVAEREDDPNDLTGRPARWVRAWFYWLRGTSTADDLLLNIDGGVYREVSVSWRYRAAACSVCGGDIRACPHTPGQTVRGRVCHFIVDEVTDVLEGSLVYRGADRNAELTGARAGDGAARRTGDPSRGAVWSLARALSRLPRSLRTAAVAGPVPDGACRLLWRLGFAVRRCSDDAPAFLDPQDPDASEPDLLVLARGEDPGALPPSVPLAAHVVLLPGSCAGGRSVRDRSAASLLQRLGYTTVDAGGTILAERCRS